MNNYTPSHIHKYIKTGVVYYSSPPQYDYKCECGKIIRKEEGEIEVRELTDEIKRKYGIK